MKKLIISAFLVFSAVLLVACSAGQQGTSDGSVTEDLPELMPARPGSDVTGDPSGYLEDLKEVSGTVKEVNDGLVLIELSDNGGEFMLRFSENTRWNEGLNQEILTGNTITCLVRPEPTFAEPSQGEVLEVMANDIA